MQGEGIDLIAFAFNVASSMCNLEPLSYEEAMNSHEAQKCKESLKEEMRSLEKNIDMEGRYKNNGLKMTV